MGSTPWQHGACPLSDVDVRLEAAPTRVCRVGRHWDAARAAERRACTNGGPRQRWEEQLVPERQTWRRHFDQSDCGGAATPLRSDAATPLRDGDQIDHVNCVISHCTPRRPYLHYAFCLVFVLRVPPNLLT
jgi:hypothetical protein